MKKYLFILVLIICTLTNYAQQTGTFTDTRDGKVYKTITIGKQTIMAENFAYKPETGNFWAYDDNKENISKYGYLYNWVTANKIAPKGWHLPSKEDWDIFYKNFGNTDTTVYANLKNIEKFQFNFLLSGFRSSKGDFNFMETTDYFWSSTPRDNDQAWRFNYNSEMFEAGLYYSNQTCGFSVRLFKD